MKRKHIVLVIAVVWASVTYGQSRHYSFGFSTPKQMQEFFRYPEKKQMPVISGHRGGIGAGFPENSIAAFDNILKYTNAFFEVDPRLTKDSVVVLMHDATLERTTNGKGKVSDYTYKQLKKLRLKDKDGNVTKYRIPTLLEALKWSKGKTVLNLDHKGVPFGMIFNIIKKSGNPVVMLTIHTPEQAKFYLEKDSNSMFSVHILNKKSFDEYKAAHIPWNNMIAYIGPRLKEENRVLLQLLHEKGVMCMVSAAPSFDKLPEPVQRDEAYRLVFDEGVDILESDLPIQAAKAVGL